MINENTSKSNKLLEILSTRKSKYIVGTILLSGIGITLPRIFHILAGSTAGATFLPMHIAILIAALTFGLTSSVIVASSSVICSYLLIGMPTLARLPYMIIELLIYAVLLSLFNKKFKSYISLTLTIVLGRILYAGVLFAAVNIFDLQTYGISVMESIIAGLPGIAIQLALVPIISKTLKEGLKLND